MKKILLASLLPLALAAYAAPDASLSKQSAFLRTLEKEAPQTYQALNGSTLADVYQAYRPQLIQKLQQSSDATFSKYANSFIKATEQLGQQDPATCYAMLSSQQVPTLLELQLALTSNTPYIDRVMKTLLTDAGGWQPPNLDTAGDPLEQVITDLKADGHGEGMKYVFEGQKAENAKQMQAACDAAVAFFKALNRPSDANRFIALRFMLAVDS